MRERAGEPQSGARAHAAQKRLLNTDAGGNLVAELTHPFPYLFGADSEPEEVVDCLNGSMAVGLWTAESPQLPLSMSPGAQW